MHDKSMSQERNQDRDSTDFYKNDVESLKSCCKCECNNNDPATTQNKKQGSYSDLRSSLTDGANRVTFELPNEENETDVFVPPSQVSDMSIFGESTSATKIPPTSIARRRGASLTLDLKDRVEKQAPSRNISVPMENDLSHISASELELELQEYKIDKNDHVDKNFVAETERVVRSFMISSYERETEKPLALPQDEEVSPDIPSPDETPIIPELFDQTSVQD
uniref:Uncharacterized protein n=1 Tax=Romanomermis culicivorax TaxID=13658 RepID=A0A915ILQ6_ROMCU